ncbi:ChaN family lipoprotein [Deferrisoma palaeochoriense]
MNVRRALLVLLLVFVASAPLARAGALRFHARDGRVLTLGELARDLAGVRAVFLGERHDDPLHHEVQLRVLDALHARGVDLALGLEMFEAGSQPALDRWNRGELLPSGLAAAFAAGWDFTLWPLYRPLFLYARNHGIPLVALNAPREVVQKVGRGGFQSLGEEERRELRVVRCDVDERYRNILRQVLGLKGDEEGEAFGRFCEAQVVWDTVMANRALDYLEAHPTKTLVVLAGRFHAWRHGIPEQLRRRRPDLPTRVVLPQLDPALADYGALAKDADYVWEVQ